MNFTQIAAPCLALVKECIDYCDFSLRMKRVFQFETYSFLPRLIDSASDNVNISQPLLSQLLSHERADCMVTSLLHAGGFRFLAAKRSDWTLSLGHLSLCAALTG